MYFQRWPDARDLAAFFRAGAEMGFGAFELSHDLPSALVDALDKRQARVVAIHHPCPRTAEFNPRDRLTSEDPEARRRAASHIRRTLRTAQRLDCNAVVLHLGYVEGNAAETVRRLRFELESRFRAGLAGGVEYGAALARLTDLLAREEPAHVERALDPLCDLVDEAARRGVRIGLETGKLAHQLPRADGLRRILASVGRAGAWFDSGHVAVQANLGLATFDEWFTIGRGRWIGMHLHDVRGLRDHLVPGLGDLDFSHTCRELPSDGVRTMEVDWYFSPAEVTRGIEALRRAGCH